MQRVNVTGSSGSGKTRLSRRLGELLGAPVLELDSVYHLPGWEPMALEPFRAKVGEFVAGGVWVVDGNYSDVRDLVWGRADTVVFLDYSRLRVMSQLTSRTLRRIATRQELWNGNRERWTNLMSLDPEKNILVWSWTRHRTQRLRFDDAVGDPRWSHVRFLRVRSPRRLRRLLSSLQGETVSGTGADSR